LAYFLLNHRVDPHNSDYEFRCFQKLCRLLEIDKVRTSCNQLSGNGFIEQLHALNAYKQFRTILPALSLKLPNITT